MTQTITAQRAKQVEVRTPTVWTLELGGTGATLIDALVEARQERLAGERTEKPLKEALKHIYEPECEDLEQGDTLQVLTNGEVRGNVIRCPGAPKVDLDLLMQAFPEAFEKCVSPTTHLRFNPA